MELVARLRKIQPFDVRCNTERATASFADSASCLMLCGICAGGEDAIWDDFLLRILDTGFGPYNGLAILPTDITLRNPNHFYSHSRTKQHLM